MASYYFNTGSLVEPFTFETMGILWEHNEERTDRAYGYPFYHYLLSDQGCGRVEADGKTYDIHEGEGILFAPYVKHSYWGTTPVWINSFITFTGKLESTIPSILNNRTVVCTRKEQYGQITEILHNMIEKYRQFPGDTKELSADCYRILLEFTREEDSLNHKDSPLYNDYVAPVIRIIEAEYASKISAQELSQRVFVSPQYLSRLFMRFLGCSVYEYLINYRMAKAKEFLRFGSHMEIQQISQRVGFDSPSHFIDMFKKRVGITPYRFRELYAGSSPYLHPDHWRE